MLRRSILLMLFAVAAWAQGPRVRPPSETPCARDELTMYAGAVTNYSRTSERIKLTVETDWRTTEPVEMILKADERAADRFRLDGKPFKEEDFAKIESAPGTLRPGMRANVWVCQDSGPAIIDWRPRSRALPAKN